MRMEQRGSAVDSWMIPLRITGCGQSRCSSDGRACTSRMLATVVMIMMMMMMINEFTAEAQLNKMVNMMAIPDGQETKNKMFNTPEDNANADPVTTLLNVYLNHPQRNSVDLTNFVQQLVTSDDDSEDSNLARRLVAFSAAHGGANRVAREVMNPRPSNVVTPYWVANGMAAQPSAANGGIAATQVQPWPAPSTSNAAVHNIAIEGFAKLVGASPNDERLLADLSGKLDLQPAKFLVKAEVEKLKEKLMALGDEQWAYRIQFLRDGGIFHFVEERMGAKEYLQHVEHLESGATDNQFAKFVCNRHATKVLRDTRQLDGLIMGPTFATVLNLQLISNCVFSVNHPYPYPLAPHPSAYPGAAGETASFHQAGFAGTGANAFQQVAGTGAFPLAGQQVAGAFPLAGQQVAGTGAFPLAGQQVAGTGAFPLAGQQVAGTGAFPLAGQQVAGTGAFPLAGQQVAGTGAFPLAGTGVVQAAGAGTTTLFHGPYSWAASGSGQGAGERAAKSSSSSSSHSTLASFFGKSSSSVSSSGSVDSMDSMGSSYSPVPEKRVKKRRRSTSKPPRKRRKGDSGAKLNPRKNRRIRG